MGSRDAFGLWVITRSPLSFLDEIIASLGRSAAPLGKLDKKFSICETIWHNSRMHHQKEAPNHEER
jgi:hypothetical protein